MRLIIEPSEEKWTDWCIRPSIDQKELSDGVKMIFDKIKDQGDEALIEFTERFDQVRLNTLQVSEEELNSAAGKIEPSLRAAILQAVKNIETFHKAQIRETLTVETMPGVICKRMARPIQQVGLYIPGGTAPLFSTILMLAIPAKIAGCKNVIMCTPPGSSGQVDPALLYCAQLTGINQVFKVGGAQAIAAMSVGTQTIPAVDKIFGPGNQYVTMAKQLASQMGTAIDLPAGPSEVLVIGDESSDPVFIAADLLSQAEHGTDSQVILCTNSMNIAQAVLKEINIQVETLPRKEIAKECLSKSLLMVFRNLKDCISFSNLYAPEHLIINIKDSETYLDLIEHAGSIFLGAYTPESAGDYASGTNHTLPTSGFAKTYGGVSTDSFIKYITAQKITPEGLKLLGPVVEKMAEAENLEAHRRAVTLRLKTLI